MDDFYIICSDKFLSTPSARRATFRSGRSSGFLSISIHALREEGDVDDLVLVLHPGDFYPRPPRGGRLSSTVVELSGDSISIHALREEGDTEAS